MEQQIKIISHRGNINGPNSKLENNPSYIENTLNQKYDVEIDIWYDKGLWLGHDCPKYKITKNWVYSKSYVLWVHCKNINAMIYLLKYESINLFGHLNDDYVLTSKHNIICKPGYPSNKNSIIVMPELMPVYPKENFDNCYGVLTDYPEKTRKKDFSLFTNKNA